MIFVLSAVAQKSLIMAQNLIKKEGDYDQYGIGI
jgi:hypothetical protein